MGKKKKKERIMECSYCKGKGTIIALGWDDHCKVCGGNGYVLVSKPVQVCSSCKGTGRRIALGWDDRCKACKGTGWAT